MRFCAPPFYIFLGVWQTPSPPAIICVQDMSSSAKISFLLVRLVFRPKNLEINPLCVMMGAVNPVVIATKKHIWLGCGKLTRSWQTSMFLHVCENECVCFCLILLFCLSMSCDVSLECCCQELHQQQVWVMFLQLCPPECNQNL